MAQPWAHERWTAEAGPKGIIFKSNHICPVRGNIREPMVLPWGRIQI